MSEEAPAPGGGIKIVAQNRKARHDYFVLETIEAGIELRGTEVKSLRDGQVSLAECYGVVENGQVFLLGMNIQPYKFGNVHNHEPARKRRLLLHASEIGRLFGQIAVKGQTLVPLKLYFKRGRAKVELGVCRGKEFEDKRETIKRRDADRDARREVAERRK
jgi:SsrA-binding protein